MRPWGKFRKRYSTILSTMAFSSRVTRTEIMSSFSTIPPLQMGKPLLQLNHISGVLSNISGILLNNISEMFYTLGVLCAP